MIKRSLQASPEGALRAKQAVARKGWTQQDLANEVGLKTRQPVGKFFAGLPVDRRVFIEICFQLGLDWRQIAGLPAEGQAQQSSSPTATVVAVAPLVRQARALCHHKIADQCGTLRMLDVARPVDIGDIYIDVNILEEITSRRWLDISDLLQNFDPTEDEFDRLGLGQVRQQRVPALEAISRYPKLMVLGKPGAGKTTFLQYVAMQCSQGQLMPDRLPVFVRLKNYADDAGKTPPPEREGRTFTSLEDYISEELSGCGVSPDLLETALKHGKALILLDGLDEVPEEDSEEILKQIRRFCQHYYSNHFAISCRIAAHSYRFDGFTEVEVADFNSAQIEAFAQKWFVAAAGKLADGPALAAQFIEQLKRPENKQIRELATTPLLLNLACLVFSAKADFPSNRIKLYQEALAILLVKWDSTRGVQRQDYYRYLPLAEKIQLLTHLGATTFFAGEYFFEQSKIQQYIADYLATLPSAPKDPVSLQLDSEAVLKAIETQHGLLIERARRIYSFSHLTFQEYFAAAKIAAASELLTLARHAGDKRWREVFLLAASMLRPADPLLQQAKQHTDTLAASDEKLREFLRWVNHKALSLQGRGKPAAARAFYFSLARAADHYLAGGLTLGPPSCPFPNFPYFPLSLYLSLAHNLDRELAKVNSAGSLYTALNFNFSSHRELEKVEPVFEKAVSRLSTLEKTLEFALELDLTPQRDRASELQRLLQKLRTELPNLEQDLANVKAWWVSAGQAWIEKFTSAIDQYSSAGVHWQFSKQQKQAIKDYYEANKLLVDCLNSDCQVTQAVREQIENSLLLSS
ncbi:NACHT domain-containing protein [Kamptonema formosum]|uniref:NACHT domain-containing protein n=1 Tax=Kamptonema formosum TaxID=331992 RepID=UPI000381113B|nr:NACHT domain-containing NTPase [Oscillatoria sp. PCC 10802]